MVRMDNASKSSGVIFRFIPREYSAGNFTSPCIKMYCYIQQGEWPGVNK